MQEASVTSRRVRETLAEISQHVAPFWSLIEKTCARALKKTRRDFLPADPRAGYLGCGAFGCVWPTADRRFVVKASIDATEGPHVALVMKHFRKHPGVAYYHRLWKLPGRIWTNSFGFTPVWIMLREEVDVTAQYSKSGGAARGYKKVESILDSIIECCSCLVYARSAHNQGTCTMDDVKKQEQKFDKVLRGLGKTPGAHVGRLIKDAYYEHSVLLGDAHFDNVGQRRHKLPEWKIMGHKKLVVTDLGNMNAPPITSDRYPAVAVMKNPEFYATDQIKTLR